MTEEEKKFFIIAICSYLPYGLKAKVWYNNDRSDSTIETITGYTDGINLNFYTDSQEEWVSAECIKPFLRSLTSMTDSEASEYHLLQDSRVDGNGNYFLTDTVESIDWLNKHFFDYRKLIEYGLAMPANNRFYKV